MMGQTCNNIDIAKEITEADVQKRFLAMYGPRLSQMPPEQATMMR